MQAITVDAVIVYITHDDRPNISSASSRHGAKRRGGLCIVVWLHGTTLNKTSGMWTCCTELAFTAVLFIALIIAAGILCIGIFFIRRFDTSTFLVIYFV